MPAHAVETPRDAWASEQGPSPSSHEATRRPCPSQSETTVSGFSVRRHPCNCGGGGPRRPANRRTARGEAHAAVTGWGSERADDGAALPAVKIKRRTKAPRPAPPNSGWLSSRPPFTNGHRQAASSGRWAPLPATRQAFIALLPPPRASRSRPSYRLTATAHCLYTHRRLPADTTHASSFCRCTLLPLPTRIAGVPIADRNYPLSPHSSSATAASTPPPLSSLR
ncbi:hypothetical protein PVAP13_5KG094687 [Panicum virgatum]|uniref:Uncharacterized protein n=1 Tax=Panicum virgatum TaxID=38727 RepID=A0A8T0SAY4_PANVG|nr:hypothetical protein PVAP13_5KG094687 [Panicum virgatum]